VFACAGKTDPPSRLILSQTSAGNGLCDYLIAGSLSVQFLCSCREAFLRPDLCLFPGAAHTGAVKAGRRAWPASGAGFPGHVLTTPSTVPRLSGSGRDLACLDAFEVALLVKYRPGDEGQLVGERDRLHVVVQPPVSPARPRLPGRTGRVGTDCPVSLSCRGSYGLRSRAIWAPVRARR
jgi:hypothetical protein